MASTQSERLCPDWVVHNNSNVHLATQKAWFVTYTPFPSNVTVGPVAGLIGLGASTLPVHGVGTVEIPVKLGDRKHAKLRLENVVHVPDYCCNIVGSPILWDGCTVHFGSPGKIVHNTGGVIARLEMRRLPCLVLSGPPVGPVTGVSALDGDGFLAVGAAWTEEEYQRWDAHSAAVQRGGSNAAPVPRAHGPTQRYTPEEKAWLKKHFGDEYHFLRMYQLSIYDEDERDEGREIVRAMMRDDDTDEDDEEEDESERFMREMEQDPTSHVADYHFTDAELEMIEKHYGHSGNFLLSYGLKPFDDEDCEEGKAIAAELVREDVGDAAVAPQTEWIGGPTVL